MQKSDWNKVLPYVGAIVIFLILSLGYVYPVLQGKRLLQSDIVKFEGMAREIKEYREETGKEALWTNSMFGGMPAFQISVKYSNNISNFFHKVFSLGLPRPADMIFLYFAGFFVFLLVMKVNVWIAFLGALAFAFSSYHFIIIEAGHNSKALAIAYMAPVLASIVHTFRGHYYSGAILFALFLALQLFSNHLQITYYLLIIVIFYGIAKFIHLLAERKHLVFLKATGVLVVAAIIAVGVNIGNFWSTYVYTSETMRGGTELTTGEEANTSGLSTEYITNWSYGVSETFSLLIPNVKGGATGMLSENDRAMGAVEPAVRRNIGQANQYWGNQPFTSGPVYVGAGILFLFILSLFFVKGPLKWGLLIAAILAVLLSWGKNFMPLTEYFINHVPGYNKFRAVSMTLVIAEMVIPAIAFIGLHKLFTGKVKITYPAFFTALGLTAGLALLFYLAPRTFFSFFSDEERAMFTDWMAQEQQQQAFIFQIRENLENARVAIFRADALRSVFFALATAAAVLLMALGKIKKPLFVVVLALLIVLDMWTVNRRYFDDTNFVPRRQVENPYQPTQANQQILRDTDPHFRVYNVTVNSFNDASTSWFHKSIGGYHGAKLQRYQELIDNHITQGNMEVLNMLNTKYLIAPGPDRQPEASLNEDALGNAWFAHELQWVDNADEELNELNNIDPEITALIDTRFAEEVNTTILPPEEQDQIELVQYEPNVLKYTAQTSGPRLAIFSEVYYPHGWKVYLNGEETSHFRANYILRAMVLPAGNHDIEFRFEPRSFYTGETIALIFSVILVLAMVGYAILQWRKTNSKGASSDTTDTF
ncbi:MAG: YfhO family protein [Bacteroidota bacterium]